MVSAADSRTRERGPSKPAAAGARETASPVAPDAPLPPTLRGRTLARLRDLDLRPSRDLGQNFLVDARYLDAVEDAAELSPSDTVLEVGGGLGVLSERLAPRVGHLHVVELDRALAAVLEEALPPLGNTSLHLGDALRLDLAALRPRPTKLVANLPYGIAAMLLLKSLEELPDAHLWVAMVQREVAERLAAAPGSRTYGASSVLTQLAGDVRLHRRVPRAAFHPAPNVDSAIVVLRRRRAAPDPTVRAFVRAAFAHRRKTLAGALALARGARDDVRERAREALLLLGHPPDARAERLSPPELEELWQLVAIGSTTTAGRSEGDGPEASTAASGPAQ